MKKDLQLLQILNARILHDLAGTIGVVDNSLSLIGTSTKDISKKAQSLAIEESANLAKKLNIFRLAYSSADLEFKPGMIFLDSFVAKVAICLVMIASEKMHFNGKISFACSNDKDNIFVKIICDATKNLVTDDNSIKILTNEEYPQIDIKNCRECYVNNLCESVGYKIIAHTKDKNLEYNLMKM
jgi:hypothetical protein